MTRTVAFIFAIWHRFFEIRFHLFHLSKHSQHGAILLKDLLDIQELVHSEKELIELDIRMKVMEIWKYTYLELTKCGGQQEYSFYD